MTDRFPSTAGLRRRLAPPYSLRTMLLLALSALTVVVIVINLVLVAPVLSRMDQT